MKTKAQIKNHPIHPMLVAMPIGLWVFSLIADILFLLGVGAFWDVVSAYAMGVGVVSALAAAVPGLIDYSIIDGPRAKRIATYHMILNLSAVVLYSINFYVRVTNGYQVAGLPVSLSLITAVALGVSGWLGGELVYVHRVGVVEKEEAGAK